MRDCRECGKSESVTKAWIKRKTYICLECRRIFDAKNRARRKSLGLRTGGGKCDPVKLKKYLKKYNRRPEVLKRKAEQQRRYRLNPFIRERNMARWVVGNAIRKGTLKRGPCEKCGSKNAHGHHEDYSKPLEVNWLCVLHHMELHKAKRFLSQRKKAGRK